jgi:hypothetical protein
VERNFTSSCCEGHSTMTIIPYLAYIRPAIRLRQNRTTPAAELMNQRTSIAQSQHIGQTTNLSMVTASTRCQCSHPRSRTWSCPILRLITITCVTLGSTCYDARETHFYRTLACFLSALKRAGRKQAFLSGWHRCGASFVCPVACPLLIAIAIAAVQRVTIPGMDPLHSSGFGLDVKGSARPH